MLLTVVRRDEGSLSVMKGFLGSPGTPGYLFALRRHRHCQQKLFALWTRADLFLAIHPTRMRWWVGGC
eukprot:601033-Prymnesium_polylepis.2